MANSKPWGGYPSRTAAAMSMQANGKTPDEIGQAMGLSRLHVQGLLNTGKATQIRQRAWARQAGTRDHMMAVPVDVVMLLIKEAEKRNCMPRDLAQAILSHTVRDGLIDAVLDGAAIPHTLHSRLDGYAAADAPAPVDTVDV